MKTIPELAEMFNYGAQMYGRLYHAKPPTCESVAKIQSSLGITLPEIFIEFAKRCPRYGVWFASIGNDYDNHIHILKLNEIYHGTTSDSLPAHLIMFNHGHDGDCDCFDISAKVADVNEYPLVYCSIPEDEDPSPPTSVISIEKTFHEYLERWAIDMKTSYEKYLKRQKHTNNPI